MDGGILVLGVVGLDDCDADSVSLERDTPSQMSITGGLDDVEVPDSGCFF